MDRSSTIQDSGRRPHQCCSHDPALSIVRGEDGMRLLFFQFTGILGALVSITMEFKDGVGLSIIVVLHIETKLHIMLADVICTRDPIMFTCFSALAKM